MNSEDVEFINSIVQQFEEQLISSYETISYQQFLSDFNSMTIPIDFFLNSDLTKYLIDNGSSSMFNELWIESNGLFSLNSDGSYLACMKKSSNSKILKEVLNMIKDVPNISKGIITQSLQAELKEKDYNSEEIKTFLAINIYSEFAINIYNRKKE